MKSPLLHIAQMVYSQPLAIIPEKLSIILNAVGPRFTLDQSALNQILDSGALSTVDPKVKGLLAYQDDEDDYDDGSSSASASDERKPKPYKLTEAGIAIIPIRGALIKRGGWISAASGISSYDSIGRTLNTALADPLVRAVMFDVDSPGGTTHGCFELCDQIFEARGDKPIWACANDLAASAAYALASSCDRLFVTRTAGVGSIGVFALHCDQSGFDEKMGAKFTYIYAGDKKVDGNPHEPISRSAKRDIQAEVDREYEIFVETVARNREAGASKIRDTEATVLFAKGAVPLLADEVGTFDQAVEKLAKKVGGGRKSSAAKATGVDASVSNVASTNDLGNTVHDEGDTTMAKKEAETDEMKKSKKAEDKEEEKKAGTAGKDCDSEDEEEKKEAASASETEEDDDEEEEDEKEEPKKKGKKASVTTLPVAATSATASESRFDASETANLCMIAGMDELTGKYIRKGYTVAQVRKFLMDRRAKLSAENPVSTSFAGGGSAGAGATSVDRAIQSAKSLVAQSGGTLKLSKAMEQVLMENPGVYEDYDDERRRISLQGTNRDVVAYVSQTQQRYMKAFGLSSAIDAVPSARSM